MAKESRDGAYHKPSTVEDLTQRNVETILHLEEASNTRRTKSDHIADAITPFLRQHVVYMGTLDRICRLDQF
jgi:hypothetical protein